MKLLPILVALLTCVNVNAYDIEVDNIYYDVNLDDMTASVTSGDNLYTGNIVIPSSIAYKGREFHVVSLTSISFQNCSNLTSVTIREGIEKIEPVAFRNCINLSKIVLPKTLKSLGSHVFWNCSSLETIDIPSGIKNIPQTCFYGCSSLKSVNIPESVTFIESNAFTGCKSLKHVELPNSLIDINNWAFAKTGLMSINIPASVIYISCDAFQNCSSLKNVFFNEGKEKMLIGPGTVNVLFGESPLESLYLGRNLEVSPSQTNTSMNINTLTRITFGQIGTNYQDFTAAQKLEEVYCKFTDPSDVTVSFSNKTYLNATLFVPTGTKEKFEKADGWKNFFSIQEFDMDETAVKAIKQTNGIKQHYNLDGKKLPYPNKGVNIIRSSNGETHKILIK